MSKYFVRSTSEKFLIGFFSFVVLLSCDNGEVKNSESKVVKTPLDNENLLIGSWEAEWKTESAGFTLQDEKTSLTMNGKIDFRDNGLVKIQAYGYDGCIFMTDTMTNELQYKVTGDTVNLLAEDDSFGLPYQILEADQNVVKLVLMEDIALTLRR